MLLDILIHFLKVDARDEDSECGLNGKQESDAIRQSRKCISRRASMARQSAAKGCRWWIRDLWCVAELDFDRSILIKLIATLGARMFTAQDSARLALILQAGDDFPAQALELLSGWSITLLARHHPGQPSARGVLEHSAASGGTLHHSTPYHNANIDRCPLYAHNNTIAE